MMYIVSRKWYHGSLPRKYTSPFWTKLPYDCSRVQSMNAKTPRRTPGRGTTAESRSEGDRSDPSGGSFESLIT